MPKQQIKKDHTSKRIKTTPIREICLDDNVIVTTEEAGRLLRIPAATLTK